MNDRESQKRDAGAWMRRVALIVALLVALPAGATSSLSFEGGGYWIDVEIGGEETAVVAAVRVHRDDDAAGVRLSPASWTVEAFDASRRRLTLRCRGDAGIPPFVLDVDGPRAVLTIEQRRIEAAFDWDM